MSMTTNGRFNYPGAKKIEPKPTPPLAGSAEVLTPGTTAEESVAKILYPKKLGVRGAA